MTWGLKRTTQCNKCPWRKGVDPNDIPGGYSLEKHKALEATIAKDGELNFDRKSMACHEMHDGHCIGWVHNQLNHGNNIGLRIKMLSCGNADKIRIKGEQHDNFQDTIPKDWERK